MPKLKTLNFHYNTAKAKESFEVTVSVSNDGQFYFCDRDIPGDLRGIAGDILGGDRSKQVKRDDEWVNNIYFDKLSELPKVIHAVIEKYESTLVTSEETKVIAYEFELSGVKTPARPNPDYDPEDRHSDEEIPAVHFGDDPEDDGRRRWRRNDSEDLRIEFKWRVYRKIQNKSALRSRWGRDEKVIYLDDKGKEVSVSDTEKVIPWTEEREAWFNGIQKQMHAMMCNIEKFMGMKEKALVQLIASNQSMLLPGKTD